MKLCVYNFKGGVGKTSIALNIALTCDFGVVTNDVYSPLEEVLPEKSFIKVAGHEKMPDIPGDYNVIFDFGGHIDERVIEILKEADVIIVPVTNDYLNLQVTINAIGEIERYSGKILVVANRTQKKDFGDISLVIGKFYKYLVVELKKSKAFSNIFEEKKSIADMVREGGLKAYHYRIINEQFNNFLKVLKIY